MATRINDKNYIAIIDKLKNAGHVLITSHINPDGDNISSSVALALGLMQLGKSPTLALNSPVPHVYKFMPLTDKYVSFGDLERDRQRFDCAAVLDVGNLKRVGDTTDIRMFTDLILNLDHHVRTEMCGDISFVDSSFSSTAEIIYCLLIDLGVKITSEIADALYIGILTDTGSFQFQNTTASTFRTASELVAFGASPEAMAKRAYFTNRAAKIVLTGKVLSTLSFDKTGKVAWITATREVIDSCKANSDDLENVINNVTTIENIEVAILFRDLNDGKIKLSLRSRNDVDVQKYALKYGGGGHKKASGMTVEGDLPVVVQKVVTELQEFIQNS